MQGGGPDPPSMLEGGPDPPHLPKTAEREIAFWHGALQGLCFVSHSRTMSRGRHFPSPKTVTHPSNWHPLQDSLTTLANNRVLRERAPTEPITTPLGPAVRTKNSGQRFSRPAMCWGVRISGGGFILDGS